MKKLMRGLNKLSSLFAGRRLKLFFWPGAALAAILVVWLVIKALASPAVGVVSQTSPAPTVVRQPDNSPGTYSGRLISFSYPPRYRKVPLKLTGSYLEVVDLLGTDHAGKEITVGIAKGSLSDNSSISYRAQHPELYRQLPRTRDSLTFLKTTGGFERTVFIDHGQYVASVALTAPGSADISADSIMVVGSLNWK